MSIRVALLSLVSSLSFACGSPQSGAGVVSASTVDPPPPPVASVASRSSAVPVESAPPAGPALPEDAARPAGGTGTTFTVTLSKAGVWAVDGTPLASHDDLLRAARAVATHSSDTRAILEVDADVLAGDVVRAIDLLKQAGVKNVAFAVARRP